jgi:hypothetical protein
MSIKAVFEDEKVAKQILNAAKRVSKKRGPANETQAAPVKRARPSYGEPLSPAQLEDSLALPEPCKDVEQLSKVTLYTNRAPLVLAFAVVLLKYTMPQQPLSSRLSLAQAVVSVNSRTKAVSLGLESGKSAEEEGWGQGQPIVNIMGRDIRVMKRWGYDWETKEDDGATQETITAESKGVSDPALWGVDLEKLKQSNGPVTAGARNTATPQLPIYTAQSARAYLLKSFDTPKSDGGEIPSPTKKGAVIASEKERNLGLLLGALELLFDSWSTTLNKEDINKRAWGWYVRVRPDVESGVAGWGGKGTVKLADILDLRRPRNPSV